MVEGYKVELQQNGEFINVKIPELPGLGMTFDKKIEDEIPRIMREVIVDKTMYDLKYERKKKTESKKRNKKKRRS